jgi:class 3 adenylate cyclase
MVIDTELEDKSGLAIDLLNIGESSLRLGRFNEAQLALQEGLQLCKELDAKGSLALALRHFSELSSARRNFAEAVRFGTQAVLLADSINSRRVKRDALKALSEAYAGMSGNTAALTKSLQFYKDYITLRDSLVNEETTKKAASREAKYAADKKDAEIKLLKKDAENQTLVRNSLLGGLSFVGVLVFVLVRSNNSRKKANTLLEGQAAQIQLANTELSEKNAVIELERKELEHSNSLLDAANEESETLLLNILPAPIAHRLKSGERAIADKFDAVTVLFADIVGFTKLSARTSPEELVQGLNAIFGRFDELAIKYGLEKIKTIGDAYMVAGGLPERSTDHAERVARFALAMQHVMNSPSSANNLGGRVQVRIGIHTGEAVAGVIGTSKFSYDLWGDTVNTASRMESHGEAGKIHVSEEVYDALKEKFVFEERGEIEVKGKGVMRTWFLLSVKEKR